MYCILGTGGQDGHSVYWSTRAHKRTPPSYAYALLMCTYVCMRSSKWGRGGTSVDGKFTRGGIGALLYQSQTDPQ